MPTSGQSVAGSNTRQLPNWSGQSLSNPVSVSNAEAAVLTAPAGGRFKILNIVLCERSGNATTVTLRKYANALGNASANNLFTALSLAANETVILDLKDMFLTNGQILAALASTGNRISIDINYEVER